MSYHQFTRCMLSIILNLKVRFRSQTGAYIYLWRWCIRSHYTYQRKQGIDMYSFWSNYILFERNWCHVSLWRGTGSTAIYPLLGRKLEPEWEFVTTGTIHLSSKTNKSLDDIAYECARDNVSTNNMELRIHLEKATERQLVDSVTSDSCSACISRPGFHTL